MSYNRNRPALRRQFSSLRRFLRVSLRHRMAYWVPRFITAGRYWQCGPFEVDGAGPIEIHMLVCREDVSCALWALISWYALSQRRDPLCIHDDGSLTPRQVALFHSLFRGCRVMARPEADRAISAHWAPSPGLRRIGRFTRWR